LIISNLQYYHFGYLISIYCECLSSLIKLFQTKFPLTTVGPSDGEPDWENEGPGNRWSKRQLLFFIHLLKMVLTEIFITTSGLFKSEWKETPCPHLETRLD
jgi:hypothetical protein